jgi:hypothetical protein
MFKGNIMDLMRQAKNIGETLKTKQEELAARRIEVSMGGDMVRMTFNGKSEAISVHIDPALLDPADPGMLEDLILSAVNEGVRQSQDMMKEELAKLTGGLNIPGLTS